MTNDFSNGGPSRRDFLAGLGAGAAMAAFPFAATPAVAATQDLQPAPKGAKIARVGIYPAIGISRVGGSQKWFHAPELPGIPADPKGGFKDGEELIKKQVQRFRVYAFDSKGRVIKEITAADATIEWSVHVANAKAAWYGFNNPLDNNELAPGLPGQLRNQYYVDDQQRAEMLIIDGGKKSISGKRVNKDGGLKDYAMQGYFWGTEAVGLGELRTDENGRLLVLPPDGVSNSPVDAAITSFADNDGWHDDWCDGPVDARVTFEDGTVMEADGSWVACVGPNFAPDIPPVSTLHDVISNLNIQEGWAKPPKGKLSYRKYIYPTFRRLALMEWLTNAANLREAWLNLPSLSTPEMMKKLADPSKKNRKFRESILEKIRNPNNLSDDAFKEEWLKMPLMLGDGVNYDGSPLQWFQFPLQQYVYLQEWAKGNFIDDMGDTSLNSATKVEDLPIELQPSALTEAALEPCSGGAFHPGVELTYYLRLAPMYARNKDKKAEPFRIARGDRQSLVQNVGRLLTPEVAFNGGNGQPAPIGPQMAGDLTRWMGLPWQCDAFSCQQVELENDFPTPVWWPALLPIDVLPEDYYNEVMNTSQTPEVREKFFQNRVPWSRGVAGVGYHANASYWDGITNMITVWQRMGFVVKKPGPTDPNSPKTLPKDMYVEVGRGNVEKNFSWTPEMGPLPEQ